MGGGDAPIASEDPGGTNGTTGVDATGREKTGCTAAATCTTSIRTAISSAIASVSRSQP